MKLGELAGKLGAELSGQADVDIHGVAGISAAKPGDITYLSDEKHLKDLASCHASAVIVPHGLSGVALPSLAVRNPRFAFAQALRLFHERPYVSGGISDRAVIGTDVVVGPDPTIHPYAVIAEGARIGNRVTLYPGVYVGANAVIGDDAVIYPNVSIREAVTIGNRVIIHSGAVIGSDGFGFVTDGGRHHKIPQVGGVIIEDDVEIGANCAIDRATLGNTVIRKGTKLDNMVHVAHNVTIGEHCLLAGQIGIAGSSTLGSYVVIGGQSGVADHITVGDRVMVGGGSGVTRDTDAGQVVAGYPAIPIREWLKAQAVFAKLPELKKLVHRLTERIEALENKS
ncbi:MAG: UDP-3-O-(3-hydroxymyristoyl)glucosamine N-acyltransferase [Nitrospirota bacterium]